MTYVEFFDKNFCENIAAALIELPDRIVLIGDKRKTLETHRDRYLDFFEKRRLTVRIEVRSMNRNHMDQILEALTEIVGEDERCVFDLTGGDELFHVAVGIICGRFPNKEILMQRLNLRTGILARYAPSGKRTTATIGTAADLKVEELVSLSGGKLLFDEAFPPNRPLPADLLPDVDRMWEICARNPKLWNEQIGILKEAAELFEKRGGTFGVDETLTVNLDTLAECFKHLWIDTDFLDLLRNAHLLTYMLDKKARRFQVSFKNSRVRRILTKSGLILELRIYSIARELREETSRRETRPLYHDVATGAVLAWSEECESDPKGEQTCQTINEIDVILMKGAIPIFVSCKNGMVEKAELYKLKSVATRFGGDYAKIVLVATALDDPSTEQRARDMGIHLVPNLGELDRAGIAETVRNFLT